MSSADKGFILTDALMAVMITVVTVSLITGAVVLEARSREAIQQTVTELEGRYEMMYQNAEGCESECEEEVDPSS